VRVNIGCGVTPTEGWANFDNSLAARMAWWPVPVRALTVLRVIDRRSCDFLKIARDCGIRFADATARIPFADRSVDAVYSSHMIEHLDRREARAFLREARRVLQPGGVLRVAAPDLALLVKGYVTTGDADDFIAGTHLGQERPVGLGPRLRAALTGPRHHLWMYDSRSLSRLLREAGFASVAVMAAGETRIADPGRLDLEERAEESVYVEAIQPV
jgi:predicted SAM-dependent methyltransferase